MHEPAIRAVELLDPAPPRNVCQRRHAVGRAIEHVQLVRHLVQHDVVAIPRLLQIELHFGQRQHQRAALPSVHAARVIADIHHAAVAGVLSATNLELARIDQHLAPAAQAADTLLQRGQASLHRDQQPPVVVQHRAGQRMEPLARQKQRGEAAQPLLALRIKPACERTAEQRAPPQRIGNGGRFESSSQRLPPTR